MLTTTEVRPLTRRMLTAPLAVLLAIATLTTPAHATTLVNDPAHPFPARTLARMQRWVDESHVPTVPGTITVSHGVTAVIAEGLAGDHYIQLAGASRFALMHELGHESQMFDGPGGQTVTGSGNYGHAGQGWSDAKIARLARLLHRPASAWGSGSVPLMEVTADAYAVASIYGHWSRWWGHPMRGRSLSWVGTPTPYDFRAGPRLFARIRVALAAR